MTPPLNDTVKVLETKRNEIRALLIHPTIHRKTFIQDTNYLILWSRSDLQALFPQWPPSEITRLRESYIISFTILVHNGWTNDRDLFRRAFFNKPDRVDARLPFTRGDLGDLNEKERTDFYERQFVFRPCIITKRKHAHIDYMDPNQPWPFLHSPVSIGSGAYGKVLQATIAKGYYKIESDFEHMSNTNEKLVAYKEFKEVKHGSQVVKDGKKDFLKEVKSLDLLRESLVDQTHIAVHLAAIVRGPKFYIMLDLAELGDLEVLLNGGDELNPNSWDTRAGDRKYRFEDKFPHARKVNFVEELEALARALDHLHKRLPKGIYCAHFDLKPRNILVYPRNTGGANVGRWVGNTRVSAIEDLNADHPKVLTDFGISSFESREPTNNSFETPTIADVANEFESDESPTPSHLIGPHRAPELHQKSTLERGSNDKCDVWSFACIASEVFAFLVGGLDSSNVRSATDKLWELRKAKKQPDGEYWFEHTTPDADESEVRFNPSVSEWFNKTLYHIVTHQPKHADWAREFCNFLNASLKIRPSDRPSASMMCKQLGRIISIMEHGPTASAARKISVSDRVDPSTWEAENFIVTEFEKASSVSHNVDLSISPTQDRFNSYRLAQMSTIPETAISSSDGSSLFSEGSHRRRPSSALDVDISGSRHGIDATDWSFKPPKKIKLYDISPDGDRAAFVHGSDPKIELSIVDLSNKASSIETLHWINMPISIKWDRLVVTSSYLIAAGGEGKGRNGCLVNLQNRRQLFITSDKRWPFPCKDMTPSNLGFFVWRFQLRGIRIWDSNTPHAAIIEREFNQDIEHVCFNTSGTCLFVWTRNNHAHYLHTINMLHPTAPTLYTDTFPGMRSPSKKTFIWPAQSDHACVVRESSVGPACYFRPDETNRANPRDILEASINPESSITAFSNNWMVTAELTGFSFGSRLRLTKHYIRRPADDAANNGTGEIPMSNPIKSGSLRTCRLAACEVQATKSGHKEIQGRDRVVVCMEDGRVWRFESATNEKFRARVGSFGAGVVHE